MRFSFATLATLYFSGQALAATKKTLDVDFGDFTGSHGQVESWLNERGLEVSSWPIDSTPLPHTYLVENVDIVDGSLRLKVPGVSGDADVTGGEVATQASDILYGTFTTVARTSPVAGVCHGFFTYTNDNAEIDIEVLTSYYTEGYGYSVQPGLEFTNQPLVDGEESTNTAVPYGFDPTADFHEYTIEWTSTASKFYVDGELKKTFKTNVPKVPAQFMWNSWSSGDPNWSAGPPTEDSYLDIRSIHLEYTTA
ncbi:hypothetical protein JCM6882_004583 [Rhodosporidiobolus microsporus]